ncbi:MAG TPA: RNA-binding protein [Stellaceae bacterium]|nr:RNA-binding protein [Stellaceae bacterium]
MPSPGLSHDAAGRRCIATGEVLPQARLIRFVADPEGTIVPDVAGNLPGRGLWLTARHDIVAGAVARRLFARAARKGVTVGADLADRIEPLLAARCCGLLGLARKAGQVVAGYVKVRALVEKGGAAVLVEAADGGADSRGKLQSLAPGLPVIDRLSAAELSAALGREHVVHAALLPGRLAQSFQAEAARLAGFRAPPRGLSIVLNSSDGTGSQ